MKKIFETIGGWLKAGWNWLCSRSIDSYLHFIAGLVIAALFAITFGMDVPVIPALFAAFIKEFIDAFRGGQFDINDFFCTCFGGLLIQIFCVL